MEGGPSSSAPPIADSEDDDTALANSEFLTRQELLKRRSRRLSRLAKCYRDHYWTLMEDLKRKHREYYWKFGKSPFRDDDNEAENGAVPGFVNNNINNNTNNNSNNNNNNNNNNNDTKNHDNNCSNQKENGDIATNSSDKLGFDDFNRCAFRGCPSKAMALSAYCHSHILYDTKQKLYKECKFVLKSTGSGPILCSKVILASSIPSLCPLHLQRAEKMFKGLLRKEGAPVASSNKLASKFHLVIAEYINLIQSRRRAAAGVNIDDVPMRDGAA